MTVTTTGSTPTPEDAHLARSLRVLVVEDELLIRWALTETLADAGHVPIEAADAASARRLAAAGRIDVILLDLFLPDSKDLTLLEALRALAPAAPVIMITAHGTPEMHDGALRLGARQVLDKPLDMPEIPGLVSRVAGTLG